MKKKPKILGIEFTRKVFVCKDCLTSKEKKMMKPNPLPEFYPKLNIVYFKEGFNAAAFYCERCHTLIEG